MPWKFLDVNESAKQAYGVHAKRNKLFISNHASESAFIMNYQKLDNYENNNCICVETFSKALIKIRATFRIDACSISFFSILQLDSVAVGIVLNLHELKSEISDNFFFVLKTEWSN